MNEYERARVLKKQGRLEEALAAYTRLAESHPEDGDLHGFIGLFYVHGHGTVKSHEEAMRWFEKGAALGSERARFYAAQANADRGEWLQMKKHLEVGAARGYPPALCRLERQYELGFGVPKDQEQAYSYFERAARAGHLPAGMRIAVRLLRGRAGLSGIVAGLWMYVKLLCSVVRVAWHDPRSDRLRY